MGYYLQRQSGVLILDAMNEAVAQKHYLRTRIKHERLTLTKPFMERAALALLGHASEAKLIEDHHSIAFYLPTRGEISCMPMIEYALKLGKKCYVPKIYPNKKRGMWFLPYSGKESVKEGAFGILEPTSPISKAVRPSELDIIFMPLVAFDLKGNRLGMGGGYYDTVLANIPKHEQPKLIGLAYNLQQVRDIPQEKWDIQMDAVITPSNYRLFDRKPKTPTKPTLTPKP